MLLLFGVLGPWCAWAGLYFFKYIICYSSTPVAFRQRLVIFLSWLILPAISCSGVIVVGRKVGHTMLWLLTFGLCCFGAEQYLYAGIFLYCKKSDSNVCQSLHVFTCPAILSALTKTSWYFRALDPVVLPSEASQAVKQRLINFLQSLSTVLAFAYCLSRWVQCCYFYVFKKIWPLLCGLVHWSLMS